MTGHPTAMPTLVDTHCHLDVPQFDDDRDEMLARARAAGVGTMIVPGIAIADMPRVLAMADRHPDIFVGVGVHPHEAGTWTDETLGRLRAWAAHPKVVAIGEIGLDYYYDHAPREVQQQVFRDQIRLAGELGKPVIVHSRDSHGDVLRLLQEHLVPAAGGVMHCFSGSLELARACIALGMYISFAGPVTFKNAHNLQEVAANLPPDRLLVETDSPYLAPVPHRGKRNEPMHVGHVAAKIAELQGVPAEELERITSENAKKLFRLPV